MTESASNMVLHRATVNIGRAKCGEHWMLDASLEDTKLLVASGYFVPVEQVGDLPGLDAAAEPLGPQGGDDNAEAGLPALVEPEGASGLDDAPG